MKLRNKRVVIIGAGFGGLAVANILAKAGAQVSVFEKNKQPGGRAGFFKAKGFRFDSGPSWYLMPEVFEHYFELLDESVSQWLSLVRLDPAYQALFEDKSSILVQSDRIQTKKSFETIEAGSGQRLTDYLKDAERVYNLAMKHFLYSNFASPKNLVHRDIMRSMPGLISALNLPLDKHVSRYFADPRLKQILEYSMVFLGTSPFEAPSMYRLMSHLDFNQGVFYPKGGIYSLVEALTAIGKKLDVKYHYASPVQRIRTVQGQATGVVLENGQSIDADIVISNADLEYTETALLERGEQTYPAAFWQKKQAAPSAILLYLGISGSLPSLKHHNILFTRDWRANFESIFERQQWTHPASMYICKPSATDKSVAPHGNENIFILVPGPAQEKPTDFSLEKHAERYLDQFIAVSGIADLRQRIVYKKIYGPEEFKRDFHAWHGTALGLSHTLRQSAFFRPKNYSRRVKQLYYVGANTVPGIGLPMCLISAEVLYKRLIDDRTAGPLQSPIVASTAEV